MTKYKIARDNSYFKNIENHFKIDREKEGKSPDYRF